MRIADFFTLFEPSVPPMPVLVKLSHPGLADWHFTNEKHDIKWEGAVYKAVPMSYKPPSAKDGIPSGGSVEIDIDIQTESGHELLAWFDEASDKAEIQAAGLIYEEEIRPVSNFKHRHGSVSWDGKKIIWNAGWDDRLQMQINPVEFNFDALTG